MPGGWGSRKNSLVLRSKILKKKIFIQMSMSPLFLPKTRGIACTSSLVLMWIPPELKCLISLHLEMYYMYKYMVIKAVIQASVRNI